MPLCPFCKKETMAPFMGLQFGTFLCKRCGVMSAIVLEKETLKNRRRESKRL